MATVALTDITREVEVAIDAPTISLTPTAETKLRDLLASRNIPNHGLRVFVAGGGCSGSAIWHGL